MIILIICSCVKRNVLREKYETTTIIIITISTNYKWLCYVVGDTVLYLKLYYLKVSSISLHHLITHIESITRKVERNLIHIMFAFFHYKLQLRACINDEMKIGLRLRKTPSNISNWLFFKHHKCHVKIVFSNNNNYSNWLFVYLICQSIQNKKKKLKIFSNRANLSPKCLSIRIRFNSHEHFTLSEYSESEYNSDAFASHTKSEISVSEFLLCIRSQVTYWSFFIQKLNALISRAGGDSKNPA